MNRIALIISILITAIQGGQASAQVQDIPGCTNPEACNFDAQANIDDGSCGFEEHPLIPNQDLTFGGPVLYWCGPLPDCSNPSVGCSIPFGYIPADPDCFDAVLARLPSCHQEWTSTCWMVYVECILGIPGCTDPYACNYVDTASFDIGDCVYPGYPCELQDPCITETQLDENCECTGIFYDNDGDGICGVYDCNDSEPGVPDFLGNCPSHVAGCPDPLALNFNPESIHESTCIYEGDCDTWEISEGWTFGLQGWLDSEQWSLSDPDLVSRDDRSLVIRGKDQGIQDTTWASITAPTSMMLTFTFGYHTLDEGAIYDPPVLEVNGIPTGFVDYISTTPPPGFILAPLDTWAHGEDMLAPDGVGTDPFLLPPDQLLPDPFLPENEANWSYPYQVPIVLNLDSGDVIRFGVATVDGIYGPASMVFSAFTHHWFCLGCKDPDACNFDELATDSDGSCDYSCYGCPDELACNFNPSAELEGGCDYSCYGCLEPEACNFDAEATLPDSCEYSCYGCPDPLACNYALDALIDDGSCEYCSCSFPPDIAAATGIPSPFEDPNTIYTHQQATLLTTDGSLFDCPFITPSPQIVPSPWGQSIAVDAGGTFILILDADSILHGLGDNEFGQINIPEDLATVQAFSGGAYHSAAITGDGSIAGWGLNEHGQLDFPEVGNLSGVEAGSRHTIAWDALGHVVVAVGANELGQCEPPAGLVISKLASSEHNVALTPEGTVVCWGSNTHGQCTPPDFNQAVIDVAACPGTSMALLADSTVAMWGRLPMPNPIGHVQAIDGNPLSGKFALLDYDGRVHQIDQIRYLVMQGMTGGIHAFSRPRCTEWCLDRDEDGLCDVEDPCVGEVIEPCGCICTNDENANGICDEEEVRGCMDSRAQNFNLSATLPGDCDEVFIQGCMSPLACNYNPEANASGLCTFDGCAGCTDPKACNFENNAVWDSGSCEYTSCDGCGDPLACNYNPAVASTGECDYCSCNQTPPKLRTHYSYHLLIQAQGEASFGGSMAASSSLGISEMDLSPLLGSVWDNVMDGSISLTGVVLLMQDGSLQSLAPFSDEILMLVLNMTRTAWEDLYGGAVYVVLLEEDIEVPEGNDFIDVAASLDMFMAVRSDGTAEGWGIRAARLNRSVNPNSTLYPNEEVGFEQWTDQLTGVTDVEISGMLNYHALLENGTVESYADGVWALPEGFNSGITEIVCSDFSCILRKEDGTVFAVEPTLNGGGDGSGEPTLEMVLADPDFMMCGTWELGIPPEILAYDQIVQFDTDVVSAVLFSDGSVGAWMGQNDASDNDIVRILTPEELGPHPVREVIGGIQLHFIDDHGILRHIDLLDLFPALYDYMEVNGLDDPLGGLFSTSVPDSIMVDHPVDCGEGCVDEDGDGICDGADDCFGERDALGVCGGECLLDADGDGVCDVLDRPGCTYVESCSYLPEATWDDGSCVFSFIGPDTDLSAWLDPCPADIDGNGQVQTQDLLVLLGNFGLTCEVGEDLFDPCTDELPFVCGSTVEYHGHSYTTLEMGSQCWFQENLRSDLYANGQPLETGLTDTDWTNSQTGAFTLADGDSAGYEIYGLLYNGYAIQDPRGLCPWGWHVPSDQDWMAAEVFVGLDPAEAEETGSRGEDISIASRFKANSNLWTSMGTNSSGFTALPAGRRMSNGDLQGVSNSAWFWSSSLDPNGGQWCRALLSGNDGINRVSPSSLEGYSVRCVKDL